MKTNEVRSNDATSDVSVAGVDMKLEVVVIPVSDVDRAKKFYGGLGWRLDADFAFDNGVPGRPVHAARLWVLNTIRHEGYACCSRLGTEPVPGRVRHRGGAGPTRRAWCQCQRGVSPGDARRAFPARRLKHPPKRTLPGSRQLPLLRHVQRPGRQLMAVAGGYDAAARARRTGRDDFRLCKRFGERPSPGGGRPRRARKAHRAAGCKLARLVRRLHGGGAGRRKIAAMKVTVSDARSCLATSSVVWSSSSDALSAKYYMS